jgi:hypothetical protein
MNRVEVRRSGWKMWWMAIGSIPLLVIGLDVLTNRRLTNWLRERLFSPQDTQIYEPRDVIWAWAMVIFAGVVVIWALKELFAPTKVVEARPDGLALKLRGPFRPSDLLPWDAIKDVQGGEINDEEETIPLLAVEVLSRDKLPDHPWGARWLDARVLGVLAQDWQESPDDVADQIGQYAVKAAVEEHKHGVSATQDD